METTVVRVLQSPPNNDASTNTDLEEALLSAIRLCAIFGPTLLVVGFLVYYYKHLLRYYCPCCAQNTEEETATSSSPGASRFYAFMTARERSKILLQIFPKSTRWRPVPGQQQEQEQQQDVDHRTCCSICLVPFKAGVPILKGTTCQHIFHYSCCMEWLNKEQHDECPYCRQTLFTQEEWHMAAVDVLGALRAQNIETRMMEQQQQQQPNQQERPELELADV